MNIILHHGNSDAANHVNTKINCGLPEQILKLFNKTFSSEEILIEFNKATLSNNK